MRGVAPGLVVLTWVVVAGAALAQTTPFDPSQVTGGVAPVAPDPVGVPAPAAVPPPVAPVVAPPTAAAPTLKPYDKVEVEDPHEPGAWDPCQVLAVHPGAYEVSCNYTRKLVRDTKVRPVGGQPVAKTAALPVEGPPFKRGALVLVSVMGLPDDWRLCLIQRNKVVESNSYEVICGGSVYNALPKWVRVDPDAPQ